MSKLSTQFNVDGNTEEASDYCALCSCRSSLGAIQRLGCQNGGCVDSVENELNLFRLACGVAKCEQTNRGTESKATNGRVLQWHRVAHLNLKIIFILASANTTYAMLLINPMAFKECCKWWVSRAFSLIWKWVQECAVGFLIKLRDSYLSEPFFHSNHLYQIGAFSHQVVLASWNPTSGAIDMVRATLVQREQKARIDVKNSGCKI
jgi:hypothetical protein